MPHPLLNKPLSKAIENNADYAAATSKSSMAQVLNLTRSPTTAVYSSPFTRPDPTTRHQNPHLRWVSVRRSRRINCLFSSDNRKQDQAKKALEGALLGKKTEYQKWDEELTKVEEIRKRTDTSGGGEGGGGGWFGRGRGWSNGDHFWQEAQQTSFALLGLIFIYLVFTKGELVLALVLNPLLFAMRGPRNALACLKSWVLQKVASTKRAKVEHMPREEDHTRISAKERVVRKWGHD